MATNPFQAAAARAGGPKPAAAKKQRDIVPIEDEAISTAIIEFCEADSREKQAKADKEIAKGTALPFCRDHFLRQFAEDGRQPETMKFRAVKEGEGNGSTVSLIFQDRGQQYPVSAEQLETLRAMLGDKLDKIIVNDTTFEFDNDILNKPGVTEAVGGKLASLVADGVLTDAECGRLLVATPRTTVRKGVLADLARLCDNDPDKMTNLLGALGSHISCFFRT